MQSLQKIETTSFTTDDVDRADRFAAWREGASVALDVEPHDRAGEQSFSAKMFSALLDDLVIIRCKIGAQKISRSADRIARDNIDHFELILFRSGCAEMDLGGTQVTVNPGQWLIVDYREPLAGNLTDYETLNIFIPRRRLEPLLTVQDGLHGMLLASDEGPGKLLSDYLSSLFAIAPELKRVQAPAASEALVQLATLALNGARWDVGDPPSTVNNALFLRAQLLIKENLQDPELSPTMIAESMGLSRARLYRIFTPCGGIADYIREMRLRRSFTDLLSPRFMHLQLSEIAYRWGFKNPNHFAKLFRTRFGVTPSDLRLKGASAATAPPGPFDTYLADQTYSHWIGNIG